MKGKKISFGSEKLSEAKVTLTNVILDWTELCSLLHFVSLPSVLTEAFLLVKGSVLLPQSKRKRGKGTD